MEQKEQTAESLLKQVKDRSPNFVRPYEEEESNAEEARKVREEGQGKGPLEK